MERWIDHAVWWQVYPLGFVGAEPRHCPPTPRRFPAWTGSSGGWTTWSSSAATGSRSARCSPPSTHGYDTVDHLRIDRVSATTPTFDRLVAACRARGVRLLLDGVFNHVGRAFPRFRRGRGRGSGLRRRRAGSAGRTGSPVGDFEGHDALVALNHDAPAVASTSSR